MNQPIAHYKNHRFPPEIIARAVWLYYRFPLSLRHVEEMLLERGIAVSYETIRRWGRKHGPGYARRIRRKPPSSGDVWYLDEVAVRIHGQECWLWRAVDQDGYVLDEIAPETSQYQGGQTFADPALEETRPFAQADRHRQVALLWSSKASGHSYG
jgi:putative transposase